MIGYIIFTQLIAYVLNFIWLRLILKQVVRLIQKLSAKKKNSTEKPDNSKKV